MSNQWLCLIDGQKLGPLSFTRLQQLAESGRLKADDYVRPAADEQWLAAKTIPKLIAAPVVTNDRSEAHSPVGKRHSGSLPVGQPIIEPDSAASASSIPRGKVVAVPPSISTTNAGSPPVDGLPFVNHPKLSVDEPAASPLCGRKKKSTGMPLVIGGVAVAGVLAVLLVLFLSGVIDFSGAGTVADTEKKTQPSAAAEFGDEEANPEDGDAAKDDSSPKKSATKPAAKNSLTTVKQFLDITKRYRGANTLPAQVTVTGLWLSASEQGEPFVAPAEGEAATPARFLVVKLKIDNAPGAAPLNYQGWGDEAVLFDEDGQAIEPLPPGKAPGRIAEQQIEPGGSLIDTLVFELASLEFEKLRLVLPYATVGIKTERSLGLELPRHALGRGVETRLASGGTSPVNAQVKAAAEPADIVDKTPAPAPQLKPAESKPKDDLDDVLKKLDARAKELDKMEKKKK